MILFFYAALLLGLILLPLYLFHYTAVRAQRRWQQLLREQLHAAAEHYGLNVSTEELLCDAIIGLDGVQRRLLLVRVVGNDQYEAELCALDRFTSCTLEQVPASQSSIGSGVLILRLISEGYGATELLFDDGTKACEKRAQQWQTLLRELLPA